MSQSITHIVNTWGFFFPEAVLLLKIIFYNIKFDSRFTQGRDILFLAYENSCFLLDTAKLFWMGVYDVLSALLTGFMRCEVTSVSF